MPDAVVVALITGACAIVAQLIISHMSNVKLFAEIERKYELSDEKLQGKIDVMNTKIEELTREVRAHNNFAQRMPVLEEKVSNLERSRTQ